MSAIPLSQAPPLRPMPRRRLAPSAMSLLRTARLGLAEAAEETAPSLRYVTAHLAALRAAAAVLATRAEPGGGRRKPRSTWDLLSEADPTLTEWASFFAAGAPKRAAAEAGLPNAVAPHEADDLLRESQTFVALIETHLGIQTQPTLPIAG